MDDSYKNTWVLRHKGVVRLVSLLVCVVIGLVLSTTIVLGRRGDGEDSVLEGAVEGAPVETPVDSTPTSDAIPAPQEQPVATSPVASPPTAVPVAAIPQEQSPPVSPPVNENTTPVTPPVELSPTTLAPVSPGTLTVGQVCNQDSQCQSMRCDDGVCQGDACVNSEKVRPGVCGCDTPDIDTDNDGTMDCIDACPNDAAKMAPGTCGCGQDDNLDSDQDGTVDCLDECPQDAAKTQSGICGCGTPDVDSDNDGTVDCLDDCPLDATKLAPGVCGCGGGTICECTDANNGIDVDQDGVPDCRDVCTDTPVGDAVDESGCTPLMCTFELLDHYLAIADDKLIGTVEPFEWELVQCLDDMPCLGRCFSLRNAQQYARRSGQWMRASIPPSNATFCTDASYCALPGSLPDTVSFVLDSEYVHVGAAGSGPVVLHVASDFSSWKYTCSNDQNPVTTLHGSQANVMCGGAEEEQSGGNDDGASSETVGNTTDTGERWLRGRN